ncbi:invasion associated locus B family protein [Amaricoccus sp. W119]|uniref:invasion associated locus B family protein n=1 Tax=Amaricoccus sp. W119 TaxID=3391833 RepID=UPI0039A5481B
MIEQETWDMTLKYRSAIALSFVVLGLTGGAALPAGAQAAATPVATHTDWSVFVAGEPRECYVVSPPKSSRALRDGQPVEVERGDIRLFVTYRPAENVAAEVSFSGGYPFRDGTPVKLEIGSQDFTLNAGSGDANSWAWPASPDIDRQIVAAFRAGATATITGVSSRGTTTIDTISLSGFTAAVQDAAGRCG